MPKKEIANSDLDFDFIPHPVSGDIIPLKDADAIKRAVRNLLLTGHYERPFSPNIGGNLKQLLFEPINSMTQLSIEILIRDTLRLYEKRISIIECKVTPMETEDGYNVNLLFGIDQLSEFVTVDFFLERLR